jgi:hypothetical protein
MQESGNVAGRAGMIYRYPNVNLRQYTKLIIDPVQIMARTVVLWRSFGRSSLAHAARVGQIRLEITTNTQRPYRPGRIGRT